MSRSESFTRAADRYLHELDTASLTARIDAAIDAASTDADRTVTDAGLRALRDEHEHW
jgi:hypothetical protein